MECQLSAQEPGESAKNWGPAKIRSGIILDANIAIILTALPPTLRLIRARRGETPNFLTRLLEMPRASDPRVGNGGVQYLFALRDTTSSFLSKARHC